MQTTLLFAALFLLFVGCATTVPDPSLDAGASEGGEPSDPEATGGRSQGSGGSNTGGISAVGGRATGGSQAIGTGGASAEGGAAPGGAGEAATGGSTATGPTPRDEALYGTLTLDYTPMSTSGQASFRLDLTNTTGVDLKLALFEIRYWLTLEGTAAETVIECDSVQGAITQKTDLTFTLVEGTQPYLSIVPNVLETFTFWSDATGPAAKIEGLQLRIHRQDYQGDDTTNDYSFQATAGANNKITVYYNGLLVLGEEPAL